MIISCQKCNKKFDIDQNLIPEKGRLLQCSSCDHKWFFKNVLTLKTVEPTISKDFEIFESKKTWKNNPIDIDNNTGIQYKTSTPGDKTIKKVDIDKIKIKKKNNFLNLPIIFVITFVAVIILLDTFKNPLEKFLPNIEFLLYNLYESIKDIGLFFRDLI